MSSYYREQGYHSRKKLLRRLRNALLLIVFVIFAGIGYVAYDAYKEAQASEQPSKLSDPVTSAFVASDEVQKTQYFQFQTPHTWTAIANETTSDKFVYRESHSGITDAQLTIYVNQSPPSIQSTRILPVTITPGKIIPDDVSPHCNTVAPGGNKQGYAQIKMLSVNFLCDSDNTNYSVLVGVKGGSNILTLERAEGKTATYIIYYENLKANPSGNQIKSIMGTFQPR
jgi:hypothetical protein